MRLLFVDDELSILMVAKRCFEAKGYEVKTALDVSSAKQILVDFRPDAIISDFNTPGGTGLDLLKFVREQDQNIPFVIISGIPYNEEAVMASGASCFCLKPILMNEMIQIVSDLIKAA